MKKSSFVALVLGTVGGILFALGMCMALLPEWNAFTPGVVFGIIGIMIGLITVFVWRKMEHKPPIKFSGKGFGTFILAAAGTLLLGVGMCFCMVWSNFVWGIIIGIIGIMILLWLIPVCKGLK